MIMMSNDNHCEGEQSQQGPGPVHEEGPPCAHHGRDEDQLHAHRQVGGSVVKMEFLSGYCYQDMICLFFSNVAKIFSGSNTKFIFAECKYGG